MKNGRGADNSFQSIYALDLWYYARLATKELIISFLKMSCSSGVQLVQCQKQLGNHTDSDHRV